MATWSEDGPCAAVFRALADPTRRQILVALRDGDLAAGEIAARFPISGPSISRHLSVLRTSGLVRERRSANRIIYSLEPEPLGRTLAGFTAATSANPPAAQVPGPKKKGKTAGKHKKKAAPPKTRPLREPTLDQAGPPNDPAGHQASSRGPVPVPGPSLESVD